MIENKFYVYMYTYPDGTPFYIGKGTGRRKNVHLCDARAGRNKNSMCVRVISKLLTNNETPIIIKIKDKLSNEDACNLEIELIKKYGRRDIHTGILTNCTDGGDRGACNLSPESIKKQTEKFIYWSQNIRVVDEEYRKKMSIGMKKYHKENPITEEARLNLSYKMTGEKNPFYGKKHTEETIEYLREINTGKIISQETRDKLKKSMTGKHKGEHNPFYGKKHSEETREKLKKAYQNRTDKLEELNIPHWNTGKTRECVICPHCGTTGGKNIMHRWHFDNCKHKTNKGD